MDIIVGSLLITCEFYLVIKGSGTPLTSGLDLEPLKLLDLYSEVNARQLLVILGLNILLIILIKVF